MLKHFITITETNTLLVEVEANTAEEALALAKTNYYNAEKGYVIESEYPKIKIELLTPIETA